MRQSLRPLPGLTLCGLSVNVCVLGAGDDWSVRIHGSGCSVPRFPPFWLLVTGANAPNGESLPNNLARKQLTAAHRCSLPSLLPRA